MKLSITNLLYLTALAAICIAAWCSEDSGTRRSLVTSIDFSPGGDQLATCLLEFNGNTRKSRNRFDRTISVLDYPSLEPVKALVRDQLRRPEPIEGVEYRRGYKISNLARDRFFWNSQNQVRHTDHHVFFLDGECKKLIHHHLDSEKEEHCADVSVGQILGYDVADDGREVLLQAETLHIDSNRFLEGEIVDTTNEGEYIVMDKPKGKGIIRLEPDEVFATLWHDVLGVEADEPVQLPVRSKDPYVRRKQGEERSPAPDSADRVQDNEILQDLSYEWKFAISRQPQKWRLAFLPPKPNGENRVALITPIHLRKLKPRRRAVPEDAQWPGTIQDMDVSRGNCRCARILANRLIVLSYASDDLPDSISIEVPIRMETNFSPSRVCLSGNGKYLAISTENFVEIRNVGDLVDPNSIGRANVRRINPEIVSSIPKMPGCDVMSLEFSPDESRLLVGDSDGFISVYNCQSSILEKQVQIPNKPRGLNRRLVYGLLCIWLAMGLAYVLRNCLTKSSPEQAQYESKDRSQLQSPKTPQISLEPDRR